MMTRPRLRHSVKISSVTFLLNSSLRFKIAHQLDANQQPLAAYVTDEFVFFLELHQPRQHLRADFARVLDQVLPLNRADRFRHGDRRQRISAVARRRRARLAERLRFAQLVAQQHARNRKSRAHALADRDDIGPRATMLDAPPFAGASEAGDHLVGDQQRAEILGHRFHRGQPVVGRYHIARRPLHRLGDDRRERAAGTHLDLLARKIDAVQPAVGILQLERAAVAIGIRHSVLAALQRAVALLRFVADKAKHAAGLAMKAAPEADRFIVPGRGTRQAQRRFDRLGAAAI